MTTQGQGSDSWWSQRPMWQKVLLVGSGALILLIVLAGLLGSGDNADDATGGTTTVATGVEVTTTTETEASTTTTTEATTTTSTSTTTTAPTTTTTLPPVLAEGSGHGDDVVEFSIPEVAVIVTITHAGSGHFGVWSLDSDFENVDLLVNTIGDYSGTSPMQFLDGETVTGFEISADGDWLYVIAPLVEAQAVRCPFTGVGDDVVLVEDFVSSGGSASISFDTDTHIGIWAWGTEGRDLIVNEIGPYQGTVRVSSGLMVWDISGEGGSWGVDCG